MNSEEVAAVMAAIEALARKNYMLALAGRRDPYLPHVTNQELADYTSALSIVNDLQKSQVWLFMGTGFSLLHPMREAVAA
jgi:hypothetical protein